eukprot:1159070-Pelagomonas_calceolata.AAC.5
MLDSSKCAGLNKAAFHPYLGSPLHDSQLCATGETGRRIVMALRAKGYQVIAGCRVGLLVPLPPTSFTRLACAMLLIFPGPAKSYKPGIWAGQGGGN